LQLYVLVFETIDTFRDQDVNMRRAIRTKEGQLGSNPTEEISSMRDSEQITAMRALPHCSKSTENGSLLKSSLKRKSYEVPFCCLLHFLVISYPSSIGCYVWTKEKEKFGHYECTYVDVIL